MRRLATLAVLVPALVGAAPPEGESAGASCRPTPAVPTGAATAALASGRDVLGERLLAAPGGPTYAGARRYLGPLVEARAAGRTSLTRSGAYYLPFGTPSGPRGSSAVVLHLADGGELVSRRVGGPALGVFVGANGGERYGSCPRRVSPARLADGWLPILLTAYVDAGGVRYRQESFTARVGSPGRLTSFVRLTADARDARQAGVIALRGPGRDLVRRVPRFATRTLLAAWRPGAPSAVVAGEERYDDARSAVERYWRGRLDEGMTVQLPERHVEDAAHGLLAQSLLLTWRYSVGNPYEQFSFPEGVDVAQVLGEWGFQDVARAILTTSLTRPDTRYPSWKMGEKLLGSATHFRLFHDRVYLDRATPELRRYVATLGRQIRRSPRGLLERERYSSDIPDRVYGLHAQAVVWAGLEGMADAWAQTGRGSLAATCRRLAGRLEAGLRRAVRESQRRLEDGSLFVPVRLLDDEPAYDSIVESRSGSYWNLVMPYALASGLFAPGSGEARGVWRYMKLHGSRLLGLVRAGAYALYGREAPFPVSGTDQVYGINVSRFLAGTGEADELLLSLYGQLAAAMAPGTYVAGEAASVAPVPGLARRAMYLPPNGAANAAFLETLRLVLVRETRDSVELAFATPRAWLRPGKRIAVSNAPTRFGPVSYAIETQADSAAVTVETPSRRRPKHLVLRLRLPAGKRIASVTVDKRPYPRFDAATGTIDLSGRQGTLRFRVGFRKSVA